MACLLVMTTLQTARFVFHISDFASALTALKPMPTWLRPMCATQHRASDRMACGMLSVPHSRCRKCFAAHGLLAHSSRPVVTKPAVH